MEVSAQVMACTLTALYAPGMQAPPLARSGWRQVDGCIRLHQPPLERVREALAQSGLWLEATALGKPGVLEEALRAVEMGQVLVAGTPDYPLRWERRLGAAAAPVLWQSGVMPSAPFLTIVGSRQPTERARKFAYAAAQEAAAHGFSIASGAAFGIDRAAAKGALRAGGRLLEILPKGLSHFGNTGYCRLSAAPRGELFSTAFAMERNTLLYAIAERALVAHARFREGGAWEGASSCLRRRLAPVFVLSGGSQACAALTALGAIPIHEIEELFAPIEERSQPSLFVRQHRAPYAA